MLKASIRRPFSFLVTACRPAFFTEVNALALKLALQPSPRHQIKKARFERAFFVSVAG
jgi:hypothetical protein